MAYATPDVVSDNGVVSHVIGDMKRSVWVVLGVLVLLVGVKVGLTLFRSHDDLKEIRQALDESIQASREGRPGGVMDLLSSSLTLNGEQAPDARRIAQTIRDQKPDVTVQKLDPVVTGEKAVMLSPVDLKVNILGAGTSFHLDEVTLVFRKESAQEWLVIPTQKWRLTEVHLPSDAFEQLSR